ncbi:2275_t:CDS:1, partial [Rhizophagus irregularis]
AKIILEGKSIFEWGCYYWVKCTYAWIGVCSSENFNCETFAGTQSTGWVLGSGGYCCNSGNYIKNYCPLFGDGTKLQFT